MLKPADVTRCQVLSSKAPVYRLAVPSIYCVKSRTGFVLVDPEMDVRIIRHSSRRIVRQFLTITKHRPGEFGVRTREYH